MKQFASRLFSGVDDDDRKQRYLERHKVAKQREDEFWASQNESACRDAFEWEGDRAAGEPVPSSASEEKTVVSSYWVDKVMSDIDKIGTDREHEICAPSPLWSEKDFEDLPEKEWPEVRITAYDRARIACRAAEARLEEEKTKGVGSGAYHEAMTELRSAKAKFQLELKRSTDDKFREMERISDWRFTNKEERNRRDRKVRTEPNKDLSRMTDEERAAHIKDQNSDRSFRRRAKANNMSQEQIDEKIAERKAKRAGNKTTLEDKRGDSLPSQ